MTRRRAALVACGGAGEAALWAAASRCWLGADGTTLWRDPDASALHVVHPNGRVVADPGGAPEPGDGLTVCRPGWIPAPDFGGAAAALGAATAMGRLLRPRQGEDAGGFEDLAPAMIAADVTRFEVSATVHGALCARLPLECLWAAPEAARRLLAALAAERDLFYEDAALRGSGPTPICPRGRRSACRTDPAARAARAGEPACPPPPSRRSMRRTPSARAATSAAAPSSATCGGGVSCAARAAARWSAPG